MERSLTKVDAHQRGSGIRRRLAPTALLGWVCALLVLQCSPDFPQTEQPFQAESYFRGKTLRIVVGVAAGGGFDAYARMFAAHLRDSLPGRPRTQVVNMPGGGAQRATRYAMAAPPDGLTMMVIPKGLIVQEILGQDVKGFDYETVSYLGLPDGERVTWALWVRSEVADSWDDVLKLSEPLLNGATRVGVESAIVVDWLEMLGVPVKNVIGYTGSGEVMAAFNRGEINATIYGSRPSRVINSYPEWLRKDPSFMTPVVRWRGTLSEEYLARGGWQQPPHILDVTDWTPVQREAFETWDELQFGSRLFALPPGVDPVVYGVLKRAFEAAVMDPAFIAAARARNLPYGLVTAEALLAAVNRVKGASPEARALLRKFYTGRN